MRTITLTSISVLLITTMLTAIPVWASQTCVDKITATCTKCHYQERICEKLGKNSQREWKKTIKRMLRYGLELNENDQASILKCLVILEGNRGNFCN